MFLQAGVRFANPHSKKMGPTNLPDWNPPVRV